MGELTCDHCGEVAYDGEHGVVDGDGGKCQSCGFPGHVSADAETEPYWVTSEADDAYCDAEEDGECAECSHAHGFVRGRANAVAALRAVPVEVLVVAMLQVQPREGGAMAEAVRAALVAAVEGAR